MEGDLGDIKIKQNFWSLVAIDRVGRSSFEFHRRLNVLGPTYRMNLPTLGLRLENGRQICFTVSAGSSIYCTSGPFTETGLIDVNYDGAAAMMFVVDVRTRGSLIKAASA